MTGGPVAANPLARLVDSVPARAAAGVSAAARLLAAAFAVVVAVDQTYDPTQVFAPVVAGLLLLSLLPLPGRAGLVVAGAGASLAFFTGMVLFSVSVGWAMAVAGIVAMAAVLVQAYQRGENPVLAGLALFSAPPLIALLVAAVVLTVDG